MDDTQRTLEPEPAVAASEATTRRRIVRAAGGGLVAMLAAVGLASCGGDVTEDEAEGDE